MEPRLEHIPSTIKERDNTYRISSQPSRPLWASSNLSRGSRTINKLERYIKKNAESQLTSLRINHQEEKPNSNAENILISVYVLKRRMYPYWTKPTVVQTVEMDRNVPKMCFHEFERIEHLNKIYMNRRSKGRKITHILFHYSRCFFEWGHHSKAHWQLLWMSFISTWKETKEILPSWASLDDMNIVL